MITRKDFTPKYHQIKQDILSQVIEKQLRPGDKLPSETKLISKYNVSRITVKHALTELVQQGTLFSLQGKGTFVAKRPVQRISGYQSFSQEVKSKGMKPSSKVVRTEHIIANEKIAGLLNITIGEAVFVLQRIRLADEQPVALETAYISETLFPNLDQFDFNQSLYQIFRENYQIYPAWAEAEIQSTVAISEIAKALKISLGDPVLIANRLSYTESFITVEYVVSAYNGNQFTFLTGRQSID